MASSSERSTTKEVSNEEVTNEEVPNFTGNLSNDEDRASTDSTEPLQLEKTISRVFSRSIMRDLNIKADLDDDFWNPASMHCTWNLKGKSLRMMITFVCIVGFSLFGYDQGLMSGILTSDQFVEVFPVLGGSDRHATVVQGAVTSCYELGCFFGALTAMWIGEKYGRRKMVIIGASVLIIGTIISVLVFKGHWAMGHFVISRVVTGYGNGFNTATIPIYQSELSKAKNRGRLVNLEGSVIAVGTFIAYWIDFGLSYAKSSISWRLPIALQIVFAAVLLIGIIGLPESPRWLISKGRLSEAAYIMGKCDDMPPNSETILAEIYVIRDAVNRFENQRITWGQLIHSGKHQYLRRMALGASSQFFQQFTGCNAAIYYSTILFQTTIGLSRRLSLILGGVFATIYAIFTIPSFFMIDKIGRRPLFMIGAAGQGTAFIISMGCLIHQTKESAKGAAFGLFLFIVFFAFTILPLPWVYPPEVNSMRTRTLATSVSTCTNWLCNFAVVMFTPIFIGEYKWGCYLFFALMNFIYVPIIYFFYPETAGRSLEEIDIIFAKAYDEGRPAYKVAHDMPHLSVEEVEREGARLGLHDDHLDEEEQ